jgi:hypothetical protein
LREGIEEFEVDCEAQQTTIVKETNMSQKGSGFIRIVWLELHILRKKSPKNDILT